MAHIRLLWETLRPRQILLFSFFFSSRRRHTRCLSDWSSDVCSSDLFNLSVNDVRPDTRLDENTPLDTIVRHIDYLIGRLGEDRVALGSDFDGAVMPRPKIGRASCRGRGESREVAGSCE